MSLYDVPAISTTLERIGLGFLVAKRKGKQAPTAPPLAQQDLATATPVKPATAAPKKISSDRNRQRRARSRKRRKAKARARRR